MHAVIYARYSSETQREASIADQLRLCRRFVEEQGMTLVRSYTDQALSGSTPFRPGYQKLLEDARSGAFEVILAEALDRLSRDLGDVAGLPGSDHLNAPQKFRHCEGEGSLMANLMTCARWAPRSFWGQPGQQKPALRRANMLIFLG